jgi:hypothetical protein
MRVVGEKVPLAEAKKCTPTPSRGVGGLVKPVMLEDGMAGG